MALIRSIPQTPVPWQRLLLAVAALWLAPVLVGFVGLAMFGIVGKTWAEFGLGVWFVANALTFSPLFSWVGWGLGGSAGARRPCASTAASSSASPLEPCSETPVIAPEAATEKISRTSPLPS